MYRYGSLLCNPLKKEWGVASERQDGDKLAVEGKEDRVWSGGQKKNESREKKIQHVGHNRLGSDRDL